MGGNISTGIRTMLVNPRTTTNRQKTIIRYGWRTAKDGMVLSYSLRAYRMKLFHVRRLDDFGRDDFARPVLPEAPEDDALVFPQTGGDFDFGRGLQTRRHL